jgi:hypothetical protein
VNLIIVPFCSRAGEPNFPQVIERNAGDDETELATSAVIGQLSSDGASRPAI